MSTHDICFWFFFFSSFFFFVEKGQMDRAMQKRVFGHMRTARAQISLRIRAV